MSTTSAIGSRRTAMTNYGHPIRFAVEILASAEEPGAGVALAAHAEELGYDLVAFADQSDEGGADAWSLASWAVARTSRVQVAATRLQTAVRPASIVARAAGSLQLLSGGRGVLVLGSGSAAEEVAVAEEAVAVIRSLWDTTHGSRVSQSGAHHRLSGAEPGPALEREVPVWLAGSGAPVAALAGRVADGWMVDLDEVGVDGLAELTKVL